MTLGAPALLVVALLLAPGLALVKALLLAPIGLGPVVVGHNSALCWSAELVVSRSAELGVSRALSVVTYVASNSTISLSNFGGLVLGCIDSYDSKKRRILQRFSRSTRFAFLCTFGIRRVKSHWEKPRRNQAKRASTSPT